MLLIIHIAIALSSLAATTYAWAAPSRRKLRLSSSLIGLTLLSGTVLVVTTHSPLLASCVTGLVYLGVALSGLGLARRKLTD